MSTLESLTSRGHHKNPGHLLHHGGKAEAVIEAAAFLTTLSQQVSDWQEKESTLCGSNSLSARHAAMCYSAT